MEHVKLTNLAKYALLSLVLVVLCLVGIWPMSAIKEAGINKRAEYAAARVFEETESAYMKNAGKDFSAFTYCVVLAETVTMDGYDGPKNVSRIYYEHEYEEYIKFTNSRQERYQSGTDDDGNPVYSSKTVYYDDFKWKWFTDGTNEVKASWYTLNGMKTKVGTNQLKTGSTPYVYKGEHPYAYGRSSVGMRGQTRHNYNWTANKATFIGYITVTDGVVTDLKIGKNYATAREMKNDYCNPGTGHIWFIVLWCIGMAGAWLGGMFALGYNTCIFDERDRCDKNHLFHYKVY